MARLWPILLIAVGIGVILNGFTRCRPVSWAANEQVSADLRLYLRRRIPRLQREVEASVAALARRFGFGPRPTQTAFEYATALGDVLPGVRPELHTVATAKVEVSYGRRELGDERIRALRDSYRRLRVGLLRLAFRRGDRPKKR